MIIIWACTECIEIVTTKAGKDEHEHVMRAKRVTESDLEWFRKDIKSTPWVAAADVISDASKEVRAINKMKSRI